jgi:uncharacterized damage-inducible protein DinB
MKPDLGPYAFLPDRFDFMISQDQSVLAAAMEIPEPEYYQDRGISHGSLHALLVHAMGSQWTWLNRFLGTSLPKNVTPADCPTRSNLAQRWPEVHSALKGFIARQTLTTLNAPLTYTNFRKEQVTLQLGQLLMHVADHGTYHRGQINSLLKIAGGKPTDPSYYPWRLKHPL